MKRPTRQDLRRKDSTQDRTRRASTVIMKRGGKSEASKPSNNQRFAPVKRAAAGKRGGLLNQRPSPPIKAKLEQTFNQKRSLAQMGGGRPKDYQQNQVIFSQGEAADSVFYIQKGNVKLTVISQHGKEAIVGILKPGDFFGEGCLAGQLRRMATATALSDCSVTWLAKNDVIRVLRDKPAFSALFLNFLLSRNIKIEEDLVDQLFNSSEQRLARVLLLLANFGKEGRPELVIPKISQENLAEMIGTTRSRVSFFMNKFRKLGFIHYNGGLEVHSSLLNVVLHD
jgi:CRP/FNR family cyclic AMP-dependent transcriptional regulator